jgi:glycosyl transferase family 2
MHNADRRWAVQASEAGTVPPFMTAGFMPDPLVSVIVPAFNAAFTVEETLRSVLAQTYERIEVIVVDDGSTDDTVATVANVAGHDARVRLERQTRRGVAAARNRAIRVASGEFIAPMDADDLWHPSKLQRQIERFQGCEPDLGLVYSWHRFIDADGLVLGDSDQPVIEGWVLHQHLQWNFIGNGSMPLFRTEALSGLSYEPSLQRHWRFGCAPGFLVGYRRSSDAMSADRVRMVRSHAAIYQILESDLSGSARTLCQRKGVEYQVQLSRNRATAGRLGEAVHVLGKALNADVAHGLRRLAAEYGRLPALALRKLLRTDPPPSRSAAFLALDPMDGALTWRAPARMRQLARMDRPGP